MFTTEDLEDFTGNIDMITLSLKKGEKAQFGDGASFSDGVLALSKGGNYLVSGTARQIVVEAPANELVRIVLSNLELRNPEGTALLCKSARKVIVTTAFKSNNVFAGMDAPGSYAIFSSCPIVINGLGEMSVTGDGGIYSEKELAVTNGTIVVDVKRDGLVGADAFAAALCTLYISAGHDAIKATNGREGASKGYVYWASGSLSCQAGNDGIVAATDIIVSNGVFDIAAGKGAPPGIGSAFLAKDGIASFTSGMFALKTSGPAVNAKGKADFYDGFYRIKSGSIGVLAGSAAHFGEAIVLIEESETGIQSHMFEAKAGIVDVNAKKIGISLSSPSGNAPNAGGMQGDAAPAEPEEGISIGAIDNNAEVTVVSGGAGFYSDGDIVFLDGTVHLESGLESGEDAVRAAGGVRLIGAHVFGCGPADFKENALSHQPALAIELKEPGKKGSAIVCKTASGSATIAKYVARADFEEIFISAPEMAEGEEYRVYIDGKPLSEVFRIEGPYTSRVEGGSK
jgi:hypothetical protein